jgi:hypothetical protein
MKELASVTKIKPRRGASTYVPTRELKNVNNVEVGDQIIMNWSKDDRKVVGESLDSKPLHLGNDYNKPRNTCCHNITRWYVKEVPMFDPRNKWRIRWDVLLMLFIIVNAICVPIDIAVNLESTVGLIIVNNVADTFFLIDILVSFRTGYVVKCYGNELLHDGPADVGCTYLKGWFLIDILSIGGK